MVGFKEVQWIPTYESMKNERQKKIYMAVSYDPPTRGKTFKVFMIEGSEKKLVEKETSRIIKVTHIERDVFRIETENAIYMVDLIDS